MLSGSSALALLAAAGYALGVALQQEGASSTQERAADHGHQAVTSATGSFPGGHESPGGLQLLGGLATHPLWWLGTACNALGYLAQVLALRQGALATVQPVLVLSVVMSLPCSALVKGRKLAWSDWRGGAEVSLGLGLVLHLVHAEPGGVGASLGALVLATTSLSLAGHLVARAAQRRHRSAGPWRAGAAGVALGCAAACLKLAAVLPSTPQGFVLQPATWLACVLTWVGFVELQQAFSQAPLASAYPIVMVVDPLVSMALGRAVLGEQISLTPLAALGAALGVVLMRSGVRRLLASTTFADASAADAAGGTAPR